MGFEWCGGGISGLYAYSRKPLLELQNIHMHFNAYLRGLNA